MLKQQILQKVRMDMTFDQVIDLTLQMQKNESQPQENYCFKLGLEQQELIMGNEKLRSLIFGQRI